MKTKVDKNLIMEKVYKRFAYLDRAKEEDVEKSFCRMELKSNKRK